mgnify:CR=1 FL=1
MVKVAWAKHLFNAYNSIKKGDKVYDTDNKLLGESDGVYGKPTYKSCGSVCLVRKGKFIWISGDVEKTDKGWKLEKEN